MKVLTTRFGELEINDEEIFYFPDGLIGFGPIKKYFTFANPGGGPFEWLQAVEPPDLAFVVADPSLFAPDYRIAVKPDALAAIELNDVAQAIIRTIVVVPRGNPMGMTANLQGPLVFNPDKHLGMQLVLPDQGFSARHPVFSESAQAPSRQAVGE